MPIAFFQLTATHPDLNINRYYEVEIVQDLMGDWVIKTYFGTIGEKGKRRQQGFKSLDALLQKLEGILREKFKDQNHLGYSYTLVSLYVQPEYQIIADSIRNSYEQATLGRVGNTLTDAGFKALYRARYKYQLSQNKKKLAKNKSRPHFPLWEK